MIFAWDVRSSVSFNECVFLAALAIDQQRILEIGSYLGRSTIALASTADRVTAVDWHKGDPHSGLDLDTEQEFRHNLERWNVADIVDVVVARIEDAAETLEPGFDGVFIDGAHDHDSVLRDYSIAARLCKPGGWIAFHDYGVGLDGFAVTEIVDGIGLVYAACETIAVIRNEDT